MASSSASSSGSSSSGSEETIEEHGGQEARGREVAAHLFYSDGLCGFPHVHQLNPRALFCLQVTHHEVCCDMSVDLKLLIESLSGHEIAAKKDLKFFLDRERRANRNVWFLRKLPPPPPDAGLWQHQEPVPPEEQITMLLLKHEGEQRTWAYPMHWVKIYAPFPESVDADIANRFVQFRRCADTPVLKTKLVLGTQSGLQPSHCDCQSTLLTRAIGSDGAVYVQSHFTARALTLSLAEVFVAYLQIATADELYETWRAGYLVVGRRGRSMSIPASGGGGSSGSGIKRPRGGK